MMGTTVVSSMLSRSRAMATITRTSFLDSLAEWKYAPIDVLETYSAALVPILESSLGSNPDYLQKKSTKIDIVKEGEGEKLIC